MFNTLSAGSI